VHFNTNRQTIDLYMYFQFQIKSRIHFGDYETTLFHQRYVTQTVLIKTMSK